FNMRKITVYALLLCLGMSADAQPWRMIAEAKKADPNFYDLQQAFDEYFTQTTKTGRYANVFRKKTGFEEGEDIPGFLQFKRWEYFWEPRVYPTGEFPNSVEVFKEWQKLQQQLQQQDNLRSAGNWTLMGPSSTVPANGGVGRINCIRFNPLNSNIVWVGAPAGGLWKSTTGGTSWSTNTDNLPVIGISDIAINPQDTSMIYIATGDGDAKDTYSMGVMKSTDGGATWSATGLTWNVSQVRVIKRLLINPANPNILLAGASSGIYQSTDAGATWTQVKNGNYKDMEFKPGDPNTVYAVNATQFFKSTDGGTTWSAAITGTGLPASGVERTAIAVTAANPNVIYALC